MKELLKLKRLINKKRPHFVRSDGHKLKALGQNWRSPKGMHSKIRLNHRGRVHQPTPSYGSPRAVRGMIREGLMPIEVTTMKDISKIDPSTQAVVIRKVGQRLRVELLKYALANKITVVNIKKTEEFIKNAEDDIKKRKEASKKHQESKKQKKEESLKKAEEKKKEEKTEAAEEQPETAKGAKSDKIKTLEKRQ